MARYRRKVSWYRYECDECGHPTQTWWQAFKDWRKHRNDPPPEPNPFADAMWTAYANALRPRNAGPVTFTKFTPLGERDEKTYRPRSEVERDLPGP